MRAIDLSNVEEPKGFEKVPAGGYIVKITMAQDMPEYELLKLEFDIVEGKYAGFFKKKYDDTGFWFGETAKSYKEKALPFFKQFVTAVEKSNPGYHWNSNEASLVGKTVGIVLGEKEYRNKKTGEVKTKYDVVSIRSVEAIRKGDFKIPELKKLDDNKSTGDNSGLYGMPANFTVGGTPAATAVANPAPTGLEDFVAIGDDDLPF